MGYKVEKNDEDAEKVGNDSLNETGNLCRLVVKRYLYDKRSIRTVE